MPNAQWQNHDRTTAATLSFGVLPSVARFILVYLGPRSCGILLAVTLSAKAQLYCYIVTCVYTCTMLNLHEDICITMFNVPLLFWAVRPALGGDLFTASCMHPHGGAAGSVQIFFLEGSLHSKSAQRVQSSNSQLIMLCSFNWIHMSSRYELKIWENHVVPVEDLTRQRIGTYHIGT